MGIDGVKPPKKPSSGLGGSNKPKLGSALGSAANNTSAGQKVAEAKELVKDTKDAIKGAAEIAAGNVVSGAYHLGKVAIKRLPGLIMAWVKIYVSSCLVITAIFITLAGFILFPPTSMDEAGASDNPVTIDGLEFPPDMEGPNSKGYYLLTQSKYYGMYGYSGGGWRCNHWGSKELVGVTYTVAKAHAEKYPNNKMMIGDLNSSGHKTHNYGRDVDLDIPGGMEVDGSGYNRQIAIDAAKLFLQTKLVRWIYYDDGTVVNTVNAWAAAEGLPGRLKEIGGHNNHFHVRLEIPDGPLDAPSC